MGLSVSGGEGGTRAYLDDLHTTSNLLSAAAATLTEASHAAAFAKLEIGGCSGLDLAADNHTLDQVLATLAGNHALAHHTADDLRDFARLLTWVIRDYSDTDSGISGLFSSIASTALALPVAAVQSGVTLVTTGSPSGAIQQFFAADPELVDLAAEATNLTFLELASSAAMDDGHAVVNYECNDLSPAAVAPPRDVEDLIDELAVRNQGVSGEISVSFVYGAAGTRRAIVDVPGTKSWTPRDTSDITSLDTNSRSINGLTTSYETGVLEAMREAGVTSDEPVMLVGHSEGGMVVVNAARDALAAGQFNVTHVVTAGAPIGRIVGDLPKSVSVLALEGRHDIVPHLDEADNPDEPNITTVTGGKDYGTIHGNHGLDTDYEPIARAVDASNNGSIRAFVDGADGFLDQPVMATERYVVTRGF